MTSPDNDAGPYAPSVFMSDYPLPVPGTTVVPPLPRSEGGPVQAVKNGMVQAVRAALSKTTMFDRDQKIYVDLDYPLVPAQYPGVWVQFSLTKLNRQGLAQEVQVSGPADSQGNATWSFIQEWMFEGRVTLTICALKSKDRDRISDAIISTLAFARPPEIVLTRSQADTKADRGFLTALDENPYIAIVVSTDTIIVSGEQASMGTPWANNELTYESTYGFDCLGQFNLAFTHDGLYQLARIDQNISIGVTEQPYEPAQWLDTAPLVPYSGVPYRNGTQNPANVDYPAL